MSKLETHRPQYHLTPKQNWMNDPNGLIFLNGYYHVFYQHHPYSTDWGPMHWGHARSKNLLDWEHLPIALYPDDNGTIFSGSIVYDQYNTCGLVPSGGLVAVFSYSSQALGVAYSVDEGLTWTMYDQNPVLPALLKDFRDPKVFRYDGSWVMVIAACDRVMFYRSENLLSWTKTGEFYLLVVDGVWECPDLFPLKYMGTTKWVLLVSFGSNAVGGGSGTGYFIGDFDGTTFRTSDPFNWLDFGRDNYAGVTWSGLSDDKRLFIAWMSNWVYAKHIPSHGWRGAMTLPRYLTLKNCGGEARLAQSPVLPESQGKGIFLRKLSINSELSATFPVMETYLLSFTIAESSATSFQVYLSRKESEEIVLLIDFLRQITRLNRTASGIVDFETSFVDTPWAQLHHTNNVDVTIFVDSSTIEVFIAQGTTVISSLFFPREKGGVILLKAEHGSVLLENFTLNEYGGR